MKTPPLLLLATLLFWGGLSHLWWAGALAGAGLEAARLFKGRWDLEDVDFNRIFSLCVVIVVALTGYIFTTSDEGGGLQAMFGSGAAGVRRVSDSSTVATFSVGRWLPLLFYPFVIAQVYNIRPSVPLTSVSLVLRLRRRRGEQSLAGRYLDMSYPYFVLCLFSAGVHPNTAAYPYSLAYFGGQCVLILWALWTLRTGRFGVKTWLAALALVVALGFLGQWGINRFERVVQNFDAQFLARFLRNRTDPFQSTTSLGQIGELKLSPRIVIRLQPEKAGMAPNYLREASYRTYQVRDRMWLSGPQGKDFYPLTPDADNKTWTLLSNKVGNATINIACYLNGRSQDGDPEGVLPVPSGCCRLLNLPTISSVVALQTNNLGTMLAVGSGLMIFDARYGPGATIDSLPDATTNAMDLKVPDDETNALSQVLAELGVTGASDADKRLAIETFFLHKFTYSTWQGPHERSPHTTALSRFLLTDRSGHCEYFATATVLLLRELNIPARYAVGYYVHETSGTGYVVRERDAHAWCLAWNRDTKMWEDFDTTPPSWVAVEAGHSPVWEALSDLRSWIGFQLERLRWRQSNLRQYILWTLSPVMIVLLYYIIFRRRSKRRAAGPTAPSAPTAWPGHDSAFYRLEKVVAGRGLPRPPQEPLSEWLERTLEEPALTDLRAPLRELLRLHYRYRFDPAGLSGEEKQAFIGKADEVCEKLAELPAA